METVICSTCGKPLEALPRIIHFSDFDQWYGNVCTQCGRVYCNHCLEIGTPTPCPECGAQHNRRNATICVKQKCWPRQVAEPIIDEKNKEILLASCLGVGWGHAPDIIFS